MQRLTPCSRIACATAAVLSLALCIGVLFYQGPHHLFVRGSIGDVLAVVFLYFLLGIIRPGSVLLRAVITGGVAFAIEGAQWMGITPPGNAPMPVQLILGSHFDPCDFLAYTVGLALAVPTDCGIGWMTRR